MNLSCPFRLMNLICPTPNRKLNGFPGKATIPFIESYLTLGSSRFGVRQFIGFRLA